MGEKVGENPAALRAAVFLLSSKNLRGGGVQTPPPPAGRGLAFACLQTTVMLLAKCRYCLPMLLVLLL